MTKKSPADAEAHVLVVIDRKSMKKIEKIAARYGIDPEEVIRELLKLETSERLQGETLH